MKSCEIFKKRMGFKTSTQLKAAYMSALIAEGKVPAIKGGRGAGKADKRKEVGVGKKDSIVISKDLVESPGIGANDKFTVRKTKLGTYEVSGWTGYPIKKIRRCCPS